ncbi:MAG: ABC transporter permease, partial [Verrucomicrobiae bacterium]|nr:ABC transporter permease [Verrucomicrobiae bacterium]
IAAHKFRSALTMLGIILGVCSLVGMFALVTGLTNGMRFALNQLGGLEKVNVSDQEPPLDQQHLAELSPGRTWRDVEAIRANCSLIEAVSPEVDLRGATVVRGNRQSRPRQVVGATPEFLTVNNFTVEHGRFITELDLWNAARVCVLGQRTWTDLFGPAAPTEERLGQTIEINSEPFTVVGVFRLYETERARRQREAGKLDTTTISRFDPRRGRTTARPGMRGGHWLAAKNEIVVVPLSTMQVVFRSAALGGTDPDPRLTWLNLRVRNAEQLDEALHQVRNTLLQTHRGVEDFGFDTRESWAESIREQSQNAIRTGGLIASISLVVGGIGIMNIMLASIRERIHEIGIRKAVGARDRDIFVQILVESTTLAMVGGIIGLVVSFGLVRVLEWMTPPDYTPVVTWPALVVSLVFSVGVGVVAGLYPAFLAARYNPIEALRLE